MARGPGGTNESSLTSNRRCLAGPLAFLSLPQRNAAWGCHFCQWANECDQIPGEFLLKGDHSLTGRNNFTGDYPPDRSRGKGIRK